MIETLKIQDVRDDATIVYPSQRSFFDKINELIEQSNRQDEAIMVITDRFQGGNWQEARTHISGILSGKTSK